MGKKVSTVIGSDKHPQKKIPIRRLIVIACILMVAIVGVVTYIAYDNHMMQTVYEAVREGRMPDGMSDAQFEKYLERLAEAVDKDRAAESTES